MFNAPPRLLLRSGPICTRCFRPHSQHYWHRLVLSIHALHASEGDERPSLRHHVRALMCMQVAGRSVRRDCRLRWDHQRQTQGQSRAHNTRRSCTTKLLTLSSGSPMMVTERLLLERPAYFLGITRLVTSCQPPQTPKPILQEHFPIPTFLRTAYYPASRTRGRATSQL